ncbi:SNF2 domain-containing protein CLASSY [Dionaea muscipula]
MVLVDRNMLLQKIAGIRSSAEELQNSGKDETWFCWHEFKLDDEVGLLCPLCAYVMTEIRDVSPPFVFPCQFPDSPDNNGATVAVNRIAACQRPSPTPRLIIVLVRRPVVLVYHSPLTASLPATSHSLSSLALLSPIN